MTNTALNLHQSALYSHKERDINHWTDLWFAPDKKAGFVIVANKDYYNSHVVGFHTKSILEKITRLKTDYYISLNAFDVQDFQNIKNVRNANNLKQIRMIAIDIDQYNLNLTIPEAEDKIFELIRNDEIPTPNLILKSRGIQLFYSLKGGLSPYRSSLTTRITRYLIDKMKHIGADGQASDVARLMRLPGSYNSRNGSRVHAEIWNKSSFSHFELLRYLPKYEPQTISDRKSNLVLSINHETEMMRRTNLARLHDFEKLLKLRNYWMTGMRNTFMYNYAFHYSLIENDLENVENKIHKLFLKINTFDRKQQDMSDVEIKHTVESAFIDAKDFIEYYQDNNYQIDVVNGDGIIKPKQTETLIRELNITTEEQKHMKTLAKPYILRENRNEKRKKDITEERRNKGVRPMTEYNEERRNKQFKRIEQLQQLMQQFPHYTQKQYAEIMKVDRSTISKLKKLINQ